MKASGVGIILAARLLRLFLLTLLLVDRRVSDALSVFAGMPALLFAFLDVLGLTVFLPGETISRTLIVGQDVLSKPRFVAMNLTSNIKNHIKISRTCV